MKRFFFCCCCCCYSSRLLTSLYAISTHHADTDTAGLLRSARGTSHGESLSRSTPPLSGVSRCSPERESQSVKRAPGGGLLRKSRCRDTCVQRGPDRTQALEQTERGNARSVVTFKCSSRKHLSRVPVQWCYSVFVFFLLFAASAQTLEVV